MAANLQNTEIKSGTGTLSMTLVSWPNPNGLAVLLVQSSALYDGTALATLSAQGFEPAATPFDNGVFCGQIFRRLSVPVGSDTTVTVPDSGDHTIAMLFQWDSTTSAPLGIAQAKFGSQQSLSASGTLSFSDTTSTTVADAPMMFGVLNNRDAASTTAYSNPTQGSFSYTPSILGQQNFTDGSGGGLLAMVCERGSPGRIDLPPPTIDYSLGATHTGIAWYVEIYEVPPPTFTSSNSVLLAHGSKLAHNLTFNQSGVTPAINGSGNDGDDFQLAGSQLQLVGDITANFNSPTDSDGNNIYTVGVTAYNEYGLSADQLITVTVYVPFTGPTWGAITAGFANAAAFNLTITSIRGVGRRMYVAVMTANQVPADVAGWTKLVPDSGSTGRGTAGAAGGLLGTVYWRDSNNTETTFAVPDSGDIQYVTAWSLVPEAGKTLEHGPSIANNFAAGTAGSFPGVTTPSDNHIVCTVLFTDRDSTAASWAPTSYGNCANGSERFDAGTTTNTGGGIAVYTSEKQAAGATGTMTATQAASAVYSYITFTVRHAATGGTNALTVTNLDTGAPTLGNPTLAQRHALIASDLATGAPTLGTPTLTQVIALSVTGLSAGAPTLGTPTIAQVHGLAPTALATGAPTLGTPTLAQVHNLSLSGLSTAAPTLGAPALAQVHALTVTGVAAGTPTLGTPTLAQRHALAVSDLATGAPTLGAPTLGQRHALTLSNLSAGVPTLGTPSLDGNLDALTVATLDAGTPTLGAPTLTQRHALVVTSLATAAPTLGTPAFAQVHVLSVTSLSAGVPTLGTPTLSENSVLQPVDLTTGVPTLGAPILRQVHTLNLSGLSTEPPTLGTPTLGNGDEGLTVAPELCIPGRLRYRILEGQERIRVLPDRERPRMTEGHNRERIVGGRNRHRIIGA